MFEYRGKEFIITGSNGYKWYKDYIGHKFVIQSESRDKKCFVVRTKRKQAGWPYGWVDKNHCELVDGAWAWNYSVPRVVPSNTKSIVLRIRHI